MASKFLRADWHRACRLARPQRSGGGGALSGEASIGDPLSSAAASRTNSGGQYSTSTSGKHLLGRACSTLEGSYIRSADALARLGSTSTSRSRSTSSGGDGGFGSVQSATAALRLGYEGCWRGGWTGGLHSSHQGLQLEGKRFLSSRRGKAAGQTTTKTNGSITAEKVLLVLETKDGSKEHTLLSRQQALDAAAAANLDLVQVSGKSDPVVCRLMDFKKEEYRKQKLKKAGARRVQKKKEIRLKGMIANHDFERKVNDVKRYLEKGDIVKVVLEANTSLLKRSGNCLNELQINFEAKMEELGGVVMKLSGGGNGYTRREIECTPKAVKAAQPSAAAAPAAAEGKSSSPLSVAAPGGVGAVNAEGEKDKPKPPPLTRVVDEEIVRGILSGTIIPKRHDDAAAASASASAASDGGIGITADDSEGKLGSEAISGEFSSGDEREEPFVDGEGLAGNARSGPGERQEEEEEEKAKTLKLGSVVIALEDVEDYVDITDEAAKADEMEMEWERYQARRQEDRRRREKDANANDGFAKRGGGRKKWKDGDDSDGGSGGRRAWSEDLSGGGYDYDTRRTSRVSGKGRGGRGGGPAARRDGATAGGDSGASFAGRGRRRESGRGGGRSGQRRESGGKGLAPSPAPSVRTTPYKWRTSIADGNGVTAGAPAQQQQQQQQQQHSLRGGSVVESAAGSRGTPRGGGGGGLAASDAGGEIRGFRARFGGGGNGGSQQQAEPPRTKVKDQVKDQGSDPADKAASAEA